MKMRTKKQAMLAREVMRAAAAVPDEMVQLVGMLADDLRLMRQIDRQAICVARGAEGTA
jgi:hypothetical protein